MPNDEKIVPDYHIIVLHENLDDWNIPHTFKGAPLKSNVAAIEAVYAYNSNEITHCCEITPSYWLEFLEYRFVFKDNDSAPEDTDTFFHGMDDASMYMHCHVLDGIIEKLKLEPFRYHHIGDPFGDIPEDEIEDGYTRFDAIRELWNTNPPL